MNAQRDGERAAGSWSAEARAEHAYLLSVIRGLYAPFAAMGVETPYWKFSMEIPTDEQVAALHAQLLHAPMFDGAADPIAAAQEWMREHRQLRRIEDGIEPYPCHGARPRH